MALCKGKVVVPVGRAGGRAGAEGAFHVLDDFEAVDGAKADMKALTLDAGGERAFATAALALRYGECTEGQPSAPITAEQLTQARRPEDVDPSLLKTFQRVRQNAMRGGQPGAAPGPPAAELAGRQHRPRGGPQPGVVGAGQGNAAPET